MIKNLPPRSFPALDDLPQATFVPVAQGGLRGNDFSNFVKAASHPQALWVRNNPPKPGEHYVHSHIFSVTDVGGCFFAGTLVQTIDGLKPIESVTVGTQVLTHKNRYRAVSHTYQAPYSGQTVTVKASGIPLPVTSTSEHPYLVVRRRDFGANARCEAYLIRKGKTKLEAVNAAAAKAEWVPASEIVRGDYLLVPIRPQAPESVKCADNEAYLFGAYLAEGCIALDYRDRKSKGRPDKAILVMAKEDDEPMRDRIRADTGRYLGIGKSYSSDESVRVTISDYKLAGRLTMFGSDSTNKRIPAALFEQSEEWRLQFLAGYFDGDGCAADTKIERCRGVLNANSASIDLMMDVQRMLAGLGIPGSVCRNYNRHKNGCFGKRDHVIYSINVGSAYSAAIIDRCARLDVEGGIPKRRKGAAAMLGTDYMLVPVTKATRGAVTGDTKYNLEVEEDNTFNTFVVVHNSNRNHDEYSRKMARLDLPSYEKFGRAYRNHDNLRPERAMGVVKNAYLNEPMGRAEVIVALNGTKEAAERNGGVVADRTLHKLANNEDVAVSQSCKVPYDQCTACGHKAKHRGEYCTSFSCKYAGCREHLGRMYDDGYQQTVDNPKCSFFDWSDVSDTRGADRTAFITGKVASSQRTMGGAELAEVLGLVAPEHLLDPHVVRLTHALRKLANHRAQARDLPWSEVVALRAKIANTITSDPLPASRGQDPHDAVADLASKGAVLPPDIWLSTVTGAPVEKCASLFTNGINVNELLNDPSAADYLASAPSISASAQRHWLAPTPASFGREAQMASLRSETGSVKLASCTLTDDRPPAHVVKEASLRYLAYQAAVLAAHENSQNLDLLLTECARDIRPTR